MTSPQVPSQTVGAAANTNQGTSLPVNSIQGTSPLTNDSQGAQLPQASKAGESTEVKPVQNEGAAAS
jgi:hypothetical protein